MLDQSAITIKYLCECPQHLNRLVDIYFHNLAKIWISDATLEKASAYFETHLNETQLPITLVMEYQNQPIGMVSLRQFDGVRADLTPWLGSLVIAPQFQKQGLARQLVDAVKKEAKKRNFSKLYLFALDASLVPWYKKLGWHVIDTVEFKNCPVTVMEIVLDEVAKRVV